MRKILPSALLLCLLLLFCAPVKIYAYADPGSGAYLYQVFYAACFGAAFYFRKWVGRLWKKDEQVKPESKTPRKN